MSDDFFIGDLIRAKQSAVDAAVTTIAKSAAGPYFLQRRPALVLGYYSLGIGNRVSAWIAYKRKNGKWYEYGWPVNLNKYELVSRPKNTAILNPFEAWQNIPQARHITLVRSKKCFYSYQWAAGTSTTDPDTPLLYQSLPMSAADLGAYIRLALSKTSDHRSQRIDGKFSEVYLREIAIRSNESGAPIKEELSTKFKLEPTKLLSTRSQISINQLFDCYELHPSVQYGGSDMFVSINESDEILGKAVLEMLDRPYMAEKKYCEKYSYLSHVMPHLEKSIIDAEF
ncbi:MULTISPECIES: hypothetical protein [unclassified Gluconobacter]|uniref:hypothetical protein n=1 Tax=unclassified Gluconobacter TaxID=2644261 RepID=UPI00176A2F30|nr:MULTISPECIES: hypothetical protein [unclassified Gluconobacter]GFE96730.1 hypothetical protein DmGdi_18030 [Gluconobacter sp. Gdi]